jgi:hypothetical protein
VFAIGNKPAVTKATAAIEDVNRKTEPRVTLCIHSTARQERGGYGHCRVLAHHITTPHEGKKHCNLKHQATPNVPACEQ